MSSHDTYTVSPSVASQLLPRRVDAGLNFHRKEALKTSGWDNSVAFKTEFCVLGLSRNPRKQVCINIKR